MSGDTPNKSVQQECADTKHSMGPLETIASWLLKAYKESPRFMVILCLISAILLFVPQKTLGLFSLDKFAAINRSWISLVFGFSFLFAASYPVLQGWDWITGKIEFQFSNRRRIERLQNLDNREKEILGQMIRNDNRAQYFDSFNPTVLNLMRWEIMGWSTSVIPTSRAPAHVSDWAWDYLRAHPELLESSFRRRD